MPSIRYYFVFFCFISMIFFSVTSKSQEVDLKSIISHTVDTNPEVHASWRQLLIGGLDVKVAKADWRPSLNASASSSLIDRNYGLEQHYVRNRAELTLSQLIYDGFLTSSEINSLKQAQVVYLYEFYNQLEQTSLEASIAYLDVQLYRELLRIAENNFKTHIEVFKQIEESAQAGVARGADLEQISGRLSLSESNVITEQSNLHDVSARFLRITGLEPSTTLSTVTININDELQASVIDEIKSAYTTNPSLLAAIYNIDSNQYSIQSARSQFHPRISVGAAYSTQTRDELGSNSTITEASVGLQFSYNFYNGGRSSAELSSALEQVNLAKDLRDKACRDMRQTIQIAYNDITHFVRQLPSLNEHRLSSARVRLAYLDQFKLGQRTLLDLLDSENEAYEASRAYVLALFTQEKAFFRLLASKGELLNFVGIMQTNIPDPAKIAARPINYDPEHICPALSVSDLNSGGNILTQDQDHDGVIDVWDNCPDTIMGNIVDGYGCVSDNSLDNLLLLDQTEQVEQPHIVNEAALEALEVMETLSLSVQFRKNLAMPKGNMREELTPIIDTLNANARLGVIIEGHASLEGGAEFNKTLSKRRAQSVADWLVEQGLKKERVYVIGYGEEKPLIDSVSENANTINRRIEAKIVQLDSLETDSRVER